MITVVLYRNPDKNISVFLETENSVREVAVMPDGYVETALMLGECVAKLELLKQKAERRKCELN